MSIVLVLNAFRHQRSIQVFPAGFIVSDGSAQRLSASKINSGRRKNTKSASIRCSTPFGIKDQFRNVSASIIQYPKLVLNAFRHQRSIQSPVLPRAICDIKVLNAFRHQRSIQDLRRREWFDFAECSTPFGIKDQFRTKLLYWSVRV